MFVQQMNMHGLLKTDDLITRFFRMSTQMCVDLCYRYHPNFLIELGMDGTGLDGLGGVGGGGTIDDNCLVGL